MSRYAELPGTVGKDFAVVKRLASMAGF